MKKKIYIAGPMRGYRFFNFPAFDAAEEKLTEWGWEPINPAALDRQAGFDPVQDPDAQPTKEFLEGAMKRDIQAILSADALALLPGWAKSDGATAEMHLAKWCGLDIRLYPSMDGLGSEDVLDEAKRLTSTDRQAQYGPPDQDFARTAKMWSALKGVEFKPSEVAMFMICLKLSRQVHQNKRDNWVDAAGYARCASFCRE